PNAMPIVASIARTRLRAYLSLRLVSTAHVQSARFFSLIRLVLSYSGEHDGTPDQKPRRRNYHTRQRTGNGTSRALTRRWHFLADGRALHRANGVSSKKTRRFNEKIAFVRRRSRPSSREDRMSRKERLLVGHK